MTKHFFSTYKCARFLLVLKESHLTAVKFIIRYLLKIVSYGLWHPKSNYFKLKSFLDSNYASDKSDKKAQVTLVNSWKNLSFHGIARSKIAFFFLLLNLNTYPLGYATFKYFGWLISLVIMTYISSLWKFFVTILMLSIYLKILCIFLEKSILLLSTPFVSFYYVSSYFFCPCQKECHLSIFENYLKT